jgi:hypothetical protein
MAADDARFGGAIPYFGRNFDKRSPKTSTCMVFVCKRLAIRFMWGTLAGTFQDSHDGGQKLIYSGTPSHVNTTTPLGPEWWRGESTPPYSTILWGKPAQSQHRMYLLQTRGLLPPYKNSFQAETENLPSLYAVAF